MACQSHTVETELMLESGFYLPRRGRFATPVILETLVTRGEAWRCRDPVLTATMFVTTVGDEGRP